MNPIIPIPKCAVSVRAATMDDLSFIDGLQKIHTKQVGWMPTAQFEGKIKAGHVLVAVAATPASPLSAEGGDAGVAATEERLGYCIGNDQYFKRDDVGIIYQMNVVPGRQRGFVGATLLKAQFERSAWGCKLYCCWCAQDIAANHFWESMGFVPLAFRAGSEKKSRVHIFWQRRIRAGDETTPYWFPSQTGSGAIREDRLVFPIPPGMHWKDELPRVLPGASTGEATDTTPALPAPPEARKPRTKKKPEAQEPVMKLGRLSFAPPAPTVESKEKPKREPRPKRKNDPKLVTAARELRDRWMEHANAHPEALVAMGKYDVSRAIEDGMTGTALPIGHAPALPALPALPAPMAA